MHQGPPPPFRHGPPQYPPGYPSPPPYGYGWQRRRTSPGLVIGLVCLAVLVLGGGITGGVLLLSSSDDSEDGPPADATVPDKYRELPRCSDVATVLPQLDPGRGTREPGGMAGKFELMCTFYATSGDNTVHVDMELYRTSTAGGVRTSGTARAQRWYAASLKNGGKEVPAPQAGQRANWRPPPRVGADDDVVKCRLEILDGNAVLGVDQWLEKSATDIPVTVESCRADTLLLAGQVVAAVQPR